MRIVFLDSSTIELAGDIDYQAIKELGEFEKFASTSPSEVASRLTGADVAITNKVVLSAEALRSTQLKHAAVVATGVNNIDLDAAKGLGVSVSNVPGYAAHSVPQHIFALILNLATGAHRYISDVQSGEWNLSETFTLLKYNTFELAGKTIGIIGFGTIGRATARIAEAFGMRVMMHRKSGMPLDGYKCSSLEGIYSNADIISLSLPLTDSNRYMIDGAVLRQMKPNSILINTARGPLVNQSDLAEALNNNMIAGAGIDVLDTEPPTEGNPLFSAKNCIITPHSAWSTREARQRLVDEVALNIKAFSNGEGRNLVT